MKRIKFTATAESAYGKKLETPVSYDVEYDAYENYGEVMAANDGLTNDEIVKVRNTERKTKERQRSQAEALAAAGIEKPTIQNDEQLRLVKMFELFVANGLDEETAKSSAAAALGIEWAE